VSEAYSSPTEDVEEATDLLSDAVFGEAIRELDPADLRDLFRAITILRQVQERIAAKLTNSARVRAAAMLLSAMKGS
jgi:hypothetical protein